MALEDVIFDPARDVRFLAQWRGQVHLDAHGRDAAGADRGHHPLRDIDVLAEPERLRRTLCYLPQDFGVYPRVSAYSMLDQMAVLKGITGKGERKSVVEHPAPPDHLWAVRDKAIAGFSGGIRQRFGIAHALIGNPDLIIVDEPTAVLDPEERNRFLNLLAGIGDNVVVILSTPSSTTSPISARHGGSGQRRSNSRASPPTSSARPAASVEEGIDHADSRRTSKPRGDLDAAVSPATPSSTPPPTPAPRVSSRRGRLEDVYFSTLSTLPPRA